MSDIPEARRAVWTAREAFACAYCWAEFAHPETRDDTPEQYWLRITEAARNSCRSVANDLMLLSVARGQSVAIPPSPNAREGDFQKLKEALGFKADYRVRQVFGAVFSTFKRRP